MGKTIFPPPLIIDQVPTLGSIAAFAFINGAGLKVHTVWLVPALEGPDNGSTFIAKEALLAGQVLKLLIRHCKVFEPTASVAWLVAKLGLTTVAVPATTDHVPVPNTAVFPESVRTGLLMHKV